MTRYEEGTKRVCHKVPSAGDVYRAKNGVEVTVFDVWFTFEGGVKVKTALGNYHLSAFMQTCGECVERKRKRLFVFAPNWESVKAWAGEKKVSLFRICHPENMDAIRGITPDGVNAVFLNGWELGFDNFTLAQEARRYLIQHGFRDDLL